MRTIFTTGQVARICKVSPRTVSRWINLRQLRGSRIRGSRKRCISRKNLDGFLKKKGVKLQKLEKEAMGNILFVSPDIYHSGHWPIVEAIRGSGDFRVDVIMNLMEADIASDTKKFDCIVIDFSMTTRIALRSARYIRNSLKNADTDLIGIVRGYEDRRRLRLFAQTFKMPISADDLYRYLLKLSKRRGLYK